MSNDPHRPLPLAALGTLHVVLGWIALLAEIGGFAVGVVHGRFDGIPLTLLAAVAATAALGPGLGLALLRGRPWGWYVAGFAYVLGAVGGGIGLRHLLLLRGTFVEGDNALRSIAIAPSVVGAIVALYLFSRPVVEFFGLEPRKRWLPLALELALAVVLVFAVLHLAGLGSGSSGAEIVQRLQGLGEQRANSDDDVAFMRERLADGSVDERVSAAWALGRSGRGDVVEPLLESARGDRNVDVRINAVASIAELGGAEIRDDLIALLEDREEQVRAAALRGLADARFVAARPQVGRLLVEDEALRAAAADALGAMGDPAAVDELLQVVGDPDEDVRSRVAYALGKLGHRRAVEPLTRMLGDGSWSVRANAAQALGMIGDPTARAALEALGTDGNEQVRNAAESALGRLR